MSFEQKNKVKWEDVQKLYTDLNKARAKFSIATVDIPSNPGLTKTENVKTLNDLVNAMSTNSFLRDVAVTGVIVPNRKDRLKGRPYELIQDTIENILGVCPDCQDNSSFGSGGGERFTFDFGFGGHGSFRDPDAGCGDRTFSGCYGYAGNNGFTPRR